VQFAWRISFCQTGDVAAFHLFCPKSHAMLGHMDAPLPAELTTESHKRHRLSRRAQALWIALPVVLTMVLGLVRVSVGNDWAIDRALTLWIQSLSSPALDGFMLAVTHLADPPFILLVMAVLAGGLVVLKRPRDALFVIVGMGTAIALSQIVKLGFGLARPIYREPLVTEVTFSYTSGHASASMALAIALIVLTWRTRWQWPALILGVLYVLVIAFSRVYLGAHFPSDVWGGWLLTIAVMALATLLRWLPAKPGAEKRE
jgi:undecaprenyl-diphosphatase